MLRKIKTPFTWHNMRRDVENFVKQCESCQKNKIWRKNKIPIKIATTASEPYEKVYIDIVVLPESDFGNKYALFMQDDLTRYLIVASMDNQGAETTNIRQTARGRFFLGCLRSTCRDHSGRQ